MVSLPPKKKQKWPEDFDPVVSDSCLDSTNMALWSLLDLIDFIQTSEIISEYW